MKKLSVFIISLAFSISSFALNVDRVEPLFWWIGMKNPTVQLMVHGPNIASSQVSLNYPGVSIETVTRSTNPNYLFIDVKISPEAKAGKLPIQFVVSKKETLTYSYELKDREPNSASRKSYTNADVMYLLFPDRFADGDPTNNSVEGLADKFNRGDSFGRHGGDIKGITDHLDYLKELGVTAIWSTPLLEDNQPSGSYHQYATTNYYRIDPRFGTNDDYKNMVAKCHQNGIKVIMDMIPNHCGSAHAWMKDLPFHDWINGDTVYTQTNYRISTISDPYTSQFDKNLNSDGWFVREMPDMNQRNPYMLTIPIFLPIVMGFDYWGLNPTDKAIWFGILALMVVEIGLITPPVGMNVYIINSLARDVPMSETFKGVIPFLISDAIRVTLLVFFPVLSLWLVRLLG